VLYNTRYYRKRLFIHTSIFAKKIDSRGGDALILMIEEELLKNAEAGDLVPGIGGIRKMRVADMARGKGKRGTLFRCTAPGKNISSLFLRKRRE
jgi:hypothetical protein